VKAVLDVLVIGLQNGAIYSLVALGLVLVYKATRVLNFAHGEVGTTAAFVAWVLIVGGDTERGALTPGALWWAAIPAVVVGVLLSMGVSTLIGRLRGSSAVTSLVATVAIALLLVATQLGFFRAQARRFPRFVEGSPCLRGAADGTCARELTIGSIVVSWHTLIILAVLGVTSLLLAAFFRTRWGTALLAMAQDPYAAELQGISVRRMTMLAWGMAGALAAIAGILGAGVFNQLTPGLMLGTFLIPGFTAAVLGGITSMAGAAVGGIVLGITVAAANQIVQSLRWNLPGPPHVAVLLVLMAVLLVRPRGLLGKEA